MRPRLRAGRRFRFGGSRHPRSGVRLDELDAIARRHHGVVTREMAGLNSQAWRRAIRGGTLVQLHPGVARLVGTADTVEQRVTAATFAVGSGTLASHRSAAFLWGAPRPDNDPVDLIVLDRSGARRREGICIHRPTDLADLTPPQRRSNIRCTNILRTLCDLGAVDPGGVEAAVGHALAARLVTLGALEAVLVAHARPGRTGVTALRSAIDSWSMDARPADSLLEHAMHRLVTRHRLPPVEFHKRIEGWEVDFWIVGTPIILECDGWTTHGLHHDQFERDRRRDGELIAAGWIVVRFTYRAITLAPGRTAERIRSVVDRWQHTAPPAFL